METSKNVKLTATYSDTFRNIDQIEYAEDGYIDSGAIGAVYEAYKSNDSKSPPPPFVAKIKGVNSAATDEEFKLEYTVLKGIYDNATELGKQAIPSAAEGITEDGSPVLALPYFSSDKRVLNYLEKHYTDNNIQQAEMLGLQTAIAYSHVMIALRASERTVTDRKTKDYYYDNETITILDWNVVGQYDKGFFEAEIRQVATLWYEFFINRIAPITIRDYQDDSWQRSSYDKIDGGAISVGMRWIIAAIHNASSDELFVNNNNEPHFSGVLKLLEAWHNLFDASYTQLDDELLLTLFREALPPGADNDALANLTRADLYWRKITDEADKKAWWEERQRWITNDSILALSSRIEGHNEDDNELLALLEKSDTKGALRLAEEQRDTERENNNPLGEAHKARWAKLFEAMTGLLRAPGRIRQNIQEQSRNIGILLSINPNLDTAGNLKLASNAITEIYQADLDENKFQQAYTLFADVKDEINFRQKAFDYRESQSPHQQLRLLHELAAEHPELFDSPIGENALPVRDIKMQINAFITTTNLNEMIELAQTLEQHRPLYPIFNDERYHPYFDLAKMVNKFINNTAKWYPTDLPRNLNTITGSQAIDGDTVAINYIKAQVYEIIITTYNDLKGIITSPNKDRADWGIAQYNRLKLDEGFITEKIFGWLFDAPFDLPDSKFKAIVTTHPPQMAWDLIEQAYQELLQIRKFFNRWDSIIQISNDVAPIPIQELQTILREGIDLGVQMSELTGQETERTIEDLFTMLQETIDAAQKIEAFERINNESKDTIQEYATIINNAKKEVEKTSASYEEDKQKMAEQIEQQVKDKFDTKLESIKESVTESAQNQVSFSLREQNKKIDGVKSQLEELEEKGSKPDKKTEELARKIDEMQQIRFTNYCQYLEDITLNNLSVKILADLLNDADKELRVQPSITRSQYDRFIPSIDIIWDKLEKQLQNNIEIQENVDSESRAQNLLEDFKRAHQIRKDVATERVQNDRP